MWLTFLTLEAGFLVCALRKAEKWPLSSLTASVVWWRIVLQLGSSDYSTQRETIGSLIKLLFVSQTQHTNSPEVPVCCGWVNTMIWGHFFESDPSKCKSIEMRIDHTARKFPEILWHTLLWEASKIFWGNYQQTHSKSLVASSKRTEHFWKYLYFETFWWFTFFASWGFQVKYLHTHYLLER